MTSILITVCGDICASCLKSLVEGDPETFYPQLQQARQVACLFIPLDLNPIFITGLAWNQIVSHGYLWIYCSWVTHDHKTGYHILWVL